MKWGTFLFFAGKHDSFSSTRQEGSLLIIAQI
jgi:hypothetical protein